MLRTLRTVACLILLCSILSQIQGRTDPSELKTYHEDEAYWIGSTHYFYLAALKQDWTSDAWQLLPARENPALGKYVMGAWLWLHGDAVRNLDLLGSFYLQFSHTPGAWGTGEAYEKRQQVAARVRPSVAQPLVDGTRRTVELDPRLLKHSRDLMVLMAMVATLGIFCIGAQTGSLFGGLIAAYLFASHPVVVQAYRLAMIDMVAIAFAILSLLVLVVRIRHRPQSRTASVYFLGAGSLLMALACGSKMNSLVVVGVYTALVPLCMIEQRWHLWQSINKHMVANPLTSRFYRHSAGSDPTSKGVNSSTLESLAPWLWGTLAGALVVFVVLNPTLMQTPIDGLVALVREHRLTAEIQDHFLGGRLKTPVERWAVLRNQVILSPVISIALCISIGWHLAILVQRRDRSGLLLLWWLVAVAMLLAWLPFSWSRYTLPLVPPTVLLLGRTVADLLWLAVRAAWQGVRKTGQTRKMSGQ